MPQNFQKIQRITKSYPFDWGVIESTDPRQFKITALKSARNVNYLQRDSINLCENFGLVMHIPDNILTIKKINNLVLGFSVTRVYLIDLERKSYEEIGGFLNADINRRNIFQTNVDVLYPDIFLRLGFVYTAFQVNNKIHYSVYDTKLDYISTSAKFVGNGIKPKITQQATKIVLVYLDRNSRILNLYVEDREGNVISKTQQRSVDIDDFKLEKVSENTFYIKWKEGNNYFKILYNLGTNLFGSVESDTTSTLKIDKSSTGDLYNFNLWTEFEYNDETYKIYWNEFRGYFVVNSQGRIVGKFLGKISPPINQEGVEYNGTVQVDGNTIYFPALLQSVQRAEDLDELFSPLGLALISIKINEDDFVGGVDRFQVTQGILASPIVKMINEKTIPEFGFCEAPEISTTYSSSSTTNLITSGEVTADYGGSVSEEVIANIAGTNINSGYNFTTLKTGITLPLTFTFTVSYTAPVPAVRKDLTFTAGTTRTADEAGEDFFLEYANNFVSVSDTGSVSAESDDIVGIGSYTDTDDVLYILIQNGSDLHNFIEASSTAVVINGTEINFSNLTSFFGFSYVAVEVDDDELPNNFDFDSVGDTFTLNIRNRDTGEYYFKTVSEGTYTLSGFTDWPSNQALVQPDESDDYELFENRDFSLESFSGPGKNFIFVKRNSVIVQILTFYSYHVDRTNRDITRFISLINENSLSGSVFDDDYITIQDLREGLKTNASAYTFDYYDYNGTSFETMFSYFNDRGGDFQIGNLTSDEQAFVNFFFEEINAELNSPIILGTPIGGNNYSLTTFEKDGANLKIGFTGSSAPARDFIANLTLTRGEVELINQNISNSAPASSVEGNERFYTIPYVPNIDAVDYVLTITTPGGAGWTVNVSPISEEFSVGTDNYVISNMFIYNDTTNDKVAIDVTFQSLPDFGDTFPFYLKGSEIGTESATDFVYDSNIGNIVTFKSTKVINDVGFVVNMDETFDLEIISGTPLTSVLSGDNQTVSYFAVYKWVDSEGRIHFSKASNFITVVVQNARIGEGSAAVSIPITVAHLNLTEKENVTIELYRSSLVVDPISNSLFNKAAEIDNEKDRENSIINDNVPQSNLKDQYVNFGIDQPNSGNIILYHQKRIYLAKDNELYYSNSAVPEREESLLFKVDSVELFDGKILGLASLDFYIAVFTENGTFLFSIGTGQIKIQALEKHIVEPGSIANFEGGVIFQSNFGIYVLDRGNNLMFIGENIKIFMEDKIVKDAYVHSDRQEIFLKLSEDNGGVVYNYLYKKFSFATLAPRARISKKNEVFHLDYKGRISSNRVEGTLVKSIVETGDLNLTEVQNFHSVRRLWLSGDFGDWKQMKIYVAYNTGPVYEEVHDVTQDVNSMYAQNRRHFGDFGQYAPTEPQKNQIMIDLQRRKIYTVRIRLELVSKNAIFSNIAFEIYVTGQYQKTLPQQRL